MMYFTSDQHFFHKNIIKYCNRKFNDVQHMHEGLISLWNETVKPEDEIYVLGDFCFSRPENIKRTTSRLNGIKHLIKGNHDHKSVTTNFRELGFESCSLSHTLDVEGVKVNLSHYPYLHGGDHSPKERFNNLRLKDEGDWLLHGHVHTSWKIKDRMINVGVDVCDMRPVSLDQIKSLLGFERVEGC